MADSVTSVTRESVTPPLTSRCLVLLIALLIVSLFVVSSSIRLDGQGLYGDELHQATAVFAFGPKRPEIIDGLSIGGIPVLNMSYSGAIKSAAFAAYLGASGHPFGVINWRMFGILLSAAGIAGFCLIAGRWIPVAVLIPFLLLVISDGTLILASRHDWGPIALAFCLRIVLLAVWLRGEMQRTPPASNSFILGLIVGIATFEKLSNVVLIGVLALLVGFSSSRRTMRHASALMAGLGIGLIPLAAVNLYSYATEGTLMLLAPGMVYGFSTEMELGTYFESYLGLGSGDIVRKFILGRGADGFHVIAEFSFVIALLVMTAGAALAWGRRNELLRASATLLACYFTVALALYVLPRPTWAHHWIIGTPLQYLAITLAACGMLRVAKAGPTHSTRGWSVCFSALVVGLLVLRTLSVVSLERSLMQGDASVRWTPSLTRFGELMSEHVDRGLVITAG